LLHDPSQRLAKEIEPFAFEEVAEDRLARILFVSAIAVTPLVVVFVDSTSLSAAVAALRSGSARRALTPR
jgi:hypothetical protein